MEKGAENILKDLSEALVAAKVNEATITAGEIEEDMNQAWQLAKVQYQWTDSYLQTEEGKAYWSQCREKAVNEKIKQKVMLLKARELGIQPDREEIEQAFNEMAWQFESAAEFNEALRSRGMTEETLKKQLSEEMTARKLISHVTQSIAVSEDEMKVYYKEHLSDYIQEAGADMAHIIVATEAEAKAVRAAYDAGIGFENLAERYGTDGTRHFGGKLGYIAYATPFYDQDFLKAAKRLEEGQVSQPVQTQFGWHLIRVTNVHREDCQRPFEEVKEEIRGQMREEKSESHLADEIERWSQQMVIEKIEKQ